MSLKMMIYNGRTLKEINTYNAIEISYIIKKNVYIAKFKPINMHNE